MHALHFPVIHPSEEELMPAGSRGPGSYRAPLALAAVGYESSPEVEGWGVVAGTGIASPIIASVYALAGDAKSHGIGGF
jgi:hypothetical protein